MMFKSFAPIVALFCVSGASAFTPTTMPKTAMTSLQMAGSNNEETTKKIAASVLAATFILGNVASVAPAQAMDESFFGSSNVIAGRSGGRAGGRSSGARMSRPSSSMSRPSSSYNTRSSTVINRTYVTPSPTVIMQPSYGYGYNPMGGLGLGLGLNAINGIGNDMRDYRQEREIQDTRSELRTSQQREAEMEARLRQLEAGQGQGQMSQQQQLQMQQQMLLQQQTAANAAAAAAAAR